MCVILSIYKDKGFTDKTKEKLANKIERLAISNPNGFSIVAMNYDDQKKMTKRLLRFDKKVLENALEKFDNVNIHLRFATSGRKDNANLHFWQYNNWHFAHNGTIPKLPGNKIFCDSNLFFKELCKQNIFRGQKYLKLAKIEKLADQKNLWGRLIFVNTNSKKIFFFGDYKSQLIENECLIISSVDLEMTKTIDFLGMHFNHPTTAKMTKELDGIFCFALGVKRFYQIKEETEYRHGYVTNYHYQDDFIQPYPSYLNKRGQGRMGFESYDR